MVEILGSLAATILLPLVEKHLKKHGAEIARAVTEKIQAFVVKAWHSLNSGGTLSTQRLLADFQAEFGIQLSGDERARFLSFIEKLEALHQTAPEAMADAIQSPVPSLERTRPEPPILAATGPSNPLSTPPPREQIPPMSEKDLKDKIVTWIVPSAIVARKLSPSSLHGFLGAGGVMIEEGTRAAILINGVVKHEVGPGIYQFDRHGKTDPDESPATFLGLLAGIFGKTGIRLLPDGSTEFKKNASGNLGVFAKDVTSYSVVICRSAPFECNLTIQSGRGGDEKEVDLLVQIHSIADFLRWTVLPQTESATPLEDGRFQDVVAWANSIRRADANRDGSLSNDSLALMIQRRFGDRANAILEKGLADISTDLESSFQQEWQRLAGDTGLKILNILRLHSGAQQKTADKVREARETEELLNVQIRLQKAQNQLGLGVGLAEQERQQIEAELQKQELARSFDLEKFGRDLDSQRLVVEHALEMLQHRHQAELDQNKAELQAKLDTHAASVAMDLARLREVGGAKIKAEAETISRTAQMDLDAKERKLRLESMKDLMEIRKSRDKSAAEDEREKLKVFKEMTPEQIMLVNPSISREAALAMAAKFRSENNQKGAELAIQQTGKMQEFLEKMAEEQRKIVTAAITSSKQTAAEINKVADGKVNQTAKLARAMKNTPSKAEQKEDQDLERGKSDKQSFYAEEAGNDEDAEN